MFYQMLRPLPHIRIEFVQDRTRFCLLIIFKIFGYPTSLGALLAQKSKFSELSKPWFADGTVTLASIKPPHHYLTKNHERFENVTLNYLDIPALKTGLDYVNAVGRQRINKRVIHFLNIFLINSTTSIIKNETKKVRLFGPQDPLQTGRTLIMCFYDSAAT